MTDFAWETPSLPPLVGSKEACDILGAPKMTLNCWLQPGSGELGGAPHSGHGTARAAGREMYSRWFIAGSDLRTMTESSSPDGQSTPLLPAISGRFLAVRHQRRRSATRPARQGRGLPTYACEHA